MFLVDWFAVLLCSQLVFVFFACSFFLCWLIGLVWLFSGLFFLFGGFLVGLSYASGPS